MARTVGLKIKKTKAKAQTPPQNPPQTPPQTGNGGAKQPENSKE